MHNGISSAEVAVFYDNELDHMKSYENGNNGRLNRIKRSLSQFVTSDMSVLDVGCGTGITSRHMANLGAEVVGIDISPKLIEYAKQRSNGQTIRYLVQDARDLDLNRKFDAIILADVFEHFIRKDVFGHVWRLLRYHTHTSSYVYLNMPSYDFSSFMTANYPKKMQIVDEAWEIDDVVSLFANWGFSPCSMQIYGIDAIAQYVEYLFIHRNALAQKYRQRMEQIYGGNEDATKRMAKKGA